MRLLFATPHFSNQIGALVHYNNANHKGKKSSPLSKSQVGRIWSVCSFRRWVAKVPPYARKSCIWQPIVNLFVFWQSCLLDSSEKRFSYLSFLVGNWTQPFSSTVQQVLVSAVEIFLKRSTLVVWLYCFCSSCMALMISSRSLPCSDMFPENFLLVDVSS